MADINILKAGSLQTALTALESAKAQTEAATEAATVVAATATQEIENLVTEKTVAFEGVGAAIAGAESAASDALAVLGISPAYVSETTADPPAATVVGTKGAKRTSNGSIQRLSWSGSAWVAQGNPVVSLLREAGTLNTLINAGVRHIALDEGTYPLSKVVLPLANDDTDKRVNIVGRSKLATEFTYAAANASDAAIEQTEGFGLTLRDLTLVGNSQGIGVRLGTGVGATYANVSRQNNLRDVDIKNFAQGIRMNGWDSIFSNVYVSGATTAWDVEQANHTTLINCRAGTSTLGMKVSTNTETFVLLNFSFENNPGKAFMTNSNSSVTMFAPYFEGNADGGDVAPSSGDLSNAFNLYASSFNSGEQIRFGYLRALNIHGTTRYAATNQFEVSANVERVDMGLLAAANSTNALQYSIDRKTHNQSDRPVWAWRGERQFTFLTNGAKHDIDKLGLVKFLTANGANVAFDTTEFQSGRCSIRQTWASGETSANRMQFRFQARLLNALQNKNWSFMLRYKLSRGTSTVRMRLRVKITMVYKDAANAGKSFVLVDGVDGSTLEARTYDKWTVYTPATNLNTDLDALKATLTADPAGFSAWDELVIELFPTGSEVTTMQGGEKLYVAGFGFYNTRHVLKTENFTPDAVSPPLLTPTFLAPDALYVPVATTANRPTGLGAADAGRHMFDSTLNKPIWWNGTVWKDATGTTV